MICLKLFLTFLKIGAFTFGGGYAMLPLIQAEVIANGWMSLEELYNFVAISESTPGPFAVNIATYIGAETGGFLGSVCATLGVILPSFIIILIVARAYSAFSRNKIISGCMFGLKSAVVGLIGATVISVFITVFFPGGLSIDGMINYSFISGILIFAIVLFLQIKKLHPIFLILISAALGIASGFLGEILLA